MISKEPAEGIPVIDFEDDRRLDFDQLRKEGIKHLEQLAGKTWTDYNSHDPGITILEQLCYALLDLNYRTSFPMEDIVGNRDQPLPSPHELLPSHPITVADYRKLLLDCEGVKNASVVPVTNPGFHIFHDQANQSLTHLPPDDDSDQKVPLKLSGLFKVLLELEAHPKLGDLNENRHYRKFNNGTILEVEFPRWDDPEVDWSHPSLLPESIRSIVNHQEKSTIIYKSWDTIPRYVIDLLQKEENGQPSMLDLYHAKVEKCHEIRDRVIRKLHQHRNLCEDFVSVEAVKIEEIGLVADIEVEGEVDMKVLLTEIFYHVNHFLSPPVTFQSAANYLKNGVPIERIYSGTLLEHGVLLDEDLSTIKEAVHISDLVNIISDLGGVRAIRSLDVSSYPGGVLLRGGQRWCIPLNTSGNYTPRIAPHKCHITFYKNDMAYKVEIVDIIDRYNARNAAHRKWDASMFNQTLPYPTGSFHELADYVTIQNDFPQNYGIGELGLPGSATELRQTQALQLKGYLLLFEQLMANYLAQLAHTGDLLNPQEGHHQTLYHQLLQDIPDISALYDESMISNTLKEPEDAYLLRKNRFLNHLLARLGMDLEDQAILNSGLEGDKPVDQVIADKLALLRNYRDLSANRSHAFNYTHQDELWDTSNVSGLEKRIRALLGIKDPQRRSLSNLGKNKGNEGFHIIENILLLPARLSDQDGNPLELQFPKIFSDPRCSDHPWKEDPYSAIITFILPNWIGRFADPRFQSYFERTAHMESPAHITLLFHWVDRKDMKKFEAAYHPWLESRFDFEMDRTKQASDLNEIITVLNSFYQTESFESPKNPITNEKSYEILEENPNWEIPDLDTGVPHWIYHDDHFIRQTRYIGHCRRKSLGEGTIVLFHQLMTQISEALEVQLIMDTDPYAEAGMVFLWQSREDYWQFLYRNHHRTAIITHVVEGQVEQVLENKVIDLKGKSILFRMERFKGHIRFKQSSPHTVGSEFLLNIPDTFEGTKYGLCTRYSNDTVFTRMEIIDEENVHVILPNKNLETLS